MFAKATSVLALVSAASVAAQGDQFTVNTPNQAVQCQPLQITWKGGQPPFYPQITKPGDTSQVIMSLPKTNDNKINGWKVKVPAGQKFTIHVTDNTGQPADTAPIGPVREGSSDCMGDDSSSSSGGSGGAAAAGGGGSGGSKSSSGGSKSSSSSGGKSSSSSDSKSSSSSGGKSSSSGGSGSSSDSSSPSSGAGGAGGGGSSSDSGASPSSEDSGSSPSSSDSGASPSSDSGSSDKGNGAATFSGVPAVVAGVVGVVVAALI